jgi:hypothetical protein
MAHDARRRSCHLAAISGASIALAGAADAATGSSEQTSELLRLSGLERQLESAGALILEGISAQKGKLPVEIEAALRRSVREAFSPQVLREAVLARLGAEIEPQQAEQALDWLRSPSGREITKLEEAASTFEGVRGLQAYAKSAS